MFGIMTPDGSSVLCNRTGTKVYVIKKWDRASMPAMKKSIDDINELLDLIHVATRRNDLTIFEFTEEQIEKLLIKKLQGY